jgi:hypothetical protein
VRAGMRCRHPRPPRSAGTSDPTPRSSHCSAGRWFGRRPERAAVRRRHRRGGAPNPLGFCAVFRRSRVVG